MLTRPRGFGSAVSIAPACSAMAGSSARYTGSALRLSQVVGVASNASCCLSTYLRVDEVWPAAVVQPQRTAAPASRSLLLMQMYGSDVRYEATAQRVLRAASAYLGQK